MSVLPAEPAGSPLLMLMQVIDSSSVMKRTRVLTVVVGAVFFVALMSLYRMLDLMLEHGMAGIPGHVEEVRRLHAGSSLSASANCVVLKKKVVITQHCWFSCRICLTCIIR